MTRHDLSRIEAERSFARTLIVAVFLAAAAGAFSSQTAFGQGTAEVQVTIRDDTGNVTPGVEVVLTPMDLTGHAIAARAPFSRKTNKKGVAIFPFLQYNAQGGGKYGISIHYEGYLIHEFKIDSRQLQSAADRGPGTVIQSIESKVGPNQQQLDLTAKPGGRATVEIRLVKAGAAEPGAPSAAAGTAPAPAGLPGQGEAPAAPADPLVAAKTLAARGNYEEAAAALTALASSDPSAKYDFELARVYHSQEKTEEERAALLKVVARDPSFPGAHYMLGKMAYQSGRLPEAIGHLEEEVKAHPDDGVSRATLATVYSEAGRKEDAVRVYEEVLARDAGNADALVGLGSLYAALGNLKKSEEAYTRVVSLDPGRADAIYYKVGLAINEQKDLSEAERARAADAFRKALEMNPKHAKAHRELAYALVGLGRLDEAKEHFKSYLELTPNAQDAATIRQFLKGS